MIYYLIKDGVLINSILADNEAIPSALVSDGFCDEFVEFSTLTSHPSIGWLWDGSTFTAPPVTMSTIMSSEVFFGRMTDDEYGALIRLSEADTLVGKKTAGFLRWIEILGAINVEAARVVAGFQFFVDQGWLTEARRDELLAPVEAR